MIRFGWELLWLIVGIMLIILGLTGQVQGGAGYDIFGIILGIGMVSWGYWRAILRRRGSSGPN